MPTPHIESELNEISPLVIMPGDPDRCKYIAEKFLTDIKLVNKVREEYAYTGYYKGKKVTIFSSGMGIPSMGIYSHELFNNYNVEAIIRVGSAGSYIEDLHVKDLFLADSSYSQSNYALSYVDSAEKTVYSSEELNEIIKKTAEELNIKLKTGRCYTTDSFYTESFDMDKFINEYSCKCEEMEAFALFTNARHLCKKAAALLTISDSFITKEVLTSEERVKEFDEMIILALESIIKLVF